MLTTPGLLWAMTFYLFLLKLIRVVSLSLATKRVFDDPKMNGLYKQMARKNEGID